MAAADNIASGEVLVSLPVTAALVVSPKERSQLPASFCSTAFYSKKPWCCPQDNNIPNHEIIFGFDVTPYIRCMREPLCHRIVPPQLHESITAHVMPGNFQLLEMQKKLFMASTICRYVQMALKLLYERQLGPESKLAPYVLALPADFSTPLSWTDAQLQALCYPHLIKEVAIFLQWLDFDHAAPSCSTPQRAAAFSACTRVTTVIVQFSFSANWACCAA